MIIYEVEKWPILSNIYFFAKIKKKSRFHLYEFNKRKLLRKF